MARYQVLIKRIVSPDGKIVAQVKSVVTTSDSENQQSDVSQNIAINLTSGTHSSTHISSNSSSTSGSTSTSGFSSISCK